MKTKTSIFLTMIFLVMYSVTFAQRPSFNKNKDILIACFDIKPDPDDIHAVAALGSMLVHPDLSGVNYFAVAGAYGSQGGSYLQSNSLFNLAFGNNWTDAHSNRSAAIAAITSKVTPILQNGGKVWVQEGGQSDVTADWLMPLINANNGINSTTTKNNVILVQHDDGFNEGQANQSKLNNVKANTRYFLLDDGNAGWTDSWGDHGPWSTPMYRNRSNSFVDNAKNSPNTVAKNLWTEADRLFNSYFPNGFPHDWSFFFTDGVDYSDCVENWWIFEIGTNADTHAKFWSRYVMNTNSGGGNNGGGGNQLAIGCANIPSTITSATSLSVPITYSHNEAGNKDIVVVAWQNGTWKGNGFARNIAKGDNKSVNVTVNINPAPSGSGWKLTAIIRPNATGWVPADKECEKPITFSSNQGGNNGGSGSGFYIINRQTNLKIRPQTTADVSPIIQVAASQTGNDVLWEKIDTDNGYFYLKNVASGKYFRPSTDADGALLEQRPTSYSGNYTQWKQVTSSGGYFYLQNRQTNKYFRPVGNDVNSPMEQRPATYTGNYTQWKFENTTRAKNGNGLNADLSDTSKFLVYPNPSHNFIKLKGVSSGDIVTVIDLSGKLIIKKTISKNENAELDLSNIESGVYFATVKNNVKEKTIRFIKQ
ncbi:T9SS C-terminal target domain-containing protein [Aquimarina sp. BL5]|uniref:T9SS type A sorting domain-containing protein n=1 Tax=Aquimarina sp. BL5 TaxID=1714860 RepID=UPI000E477369|nr:T9SS type A sorting domain-containing protein [Aquimarina sp. BL5]AXT49578.1 T9SS C-terminal target domain-containing protein [Aquimarina sp. BL5]RKN03130.1 T9SS C-terminal target domain-containing protein [Aquimarina sp. BL5]